MVNGRITENSRRAAGQIIDDIDGLNGGGARPSEVTAKTAIFQLVSRPVLWSVDPQKVAKFLKERQSYEDEVKEKQKKVPSMTVASYKVSIDCILLKSMHFVGKFDEIAPSKGDNDLTSEDIEKFIRQIFATRTGVQVNPTVIQEALRSVRVPMSITEPEARML